MGRKTLKSFRSALLASGSVAIMLGAAGAASAQDAKPQASALEEVVVTATRSSSTVNKVAMAVSALTSAALDKQGINTVNDLQREVPGLTFRVAGADNNPVVTIRGIGGNGATVGSQTTGVYLDDSALQRRAVNGLQTGNGAPFPEVFDLDRVEVLRGPQGTLYGGSSEGGTIRFITPTPSLTTVSGQLRAQVATTYNGAPTYEYAGAVGGPIVPDKLGFRVSVIDHHDGGWLDALSQYTGATVAKDVNYSDRGAFRAALKWEISPTLVITPSAYLGRDYTNQGDTFRLSSPAQSYAGGTIANGVGGCYSSAAGTTATGACKYTNGPNTYYFAAPSVTVAPFTINAMPWYNNYTTSNGIRYPTPNTPTYVASPRTTNLFLPSLAIDKDFGVLQVKSISTFVQDNTDGMTFSGNGYGAREVGSFFAGPSNCDPTGVNSIPTTKGSVTGCWIAPAYLPGFSDYQDYYNYHNDRTAKSEELRVSGNALQGKFTYVGGIYYSDSMIHMHGVENNNEYMATQILRGGLPEGFFVGNSPLPAWGIAGPLGALQDVSDRNIHMREVDRSAFGEANYNVTDKFKVTAGVRLSYYTQTFNQVYGGAVAGNVPAGASYNNPAGFIVNPAAAQAASTNPLLPNSATNPITNIPLGAQALFGKDVAGCPTSTSCPFQYTTLTDNERTSSPKVGLSYQLDPTTLVYATYAKGYRPGGVNPPVPVLQCQTDLTNWGLLSTGVPQTFKQDTVNSYELGNKARLNFGGGSIQVNSSAFYIQWQNMQYNASLSCGFAYVNNAAQASSKGGEIQATGRFGAWQFGANIGYDKAVFDQPVYQGVALVAGTTRRVIIQNAGDNLGVPDWTLALNGEYDFHVWDRAGFARLDYNYTGAYMRGPSAGASSYNPTTVQGDPITVFNGRVGLQVAKVDWSLWINNIANAQPFVAKSGGMNYANGTAASNVNSVSANLGGSSIRPRTIGMEASYRF